MNLSVKFTTDKLPVSYRMVIVSIIKECLRKGDEQAYRKYYASSTPKPFVFSVFLENFKFVEDEIQLDSFTLNLSSSDYEFIIPFLNGLQKTHRLQYKDYVLTRGQIQYGREQTVNSSRIVVKTKSPILIEDEEGKPLAPSDPNFSEQFYVIASKMSQTLRSRSLNGVVHIQPINYRKVVIKEINQTFEKARAEGRTTTSYLFFTAYHGRFILQGEPSDLKWILDTGGGLRNGQGFGHLSLEREVIIDHEA